jgi:hypothetical protein
MPTKFGGLGVLDRKAFGCAMRCRWPWLRWAASLRPWALIPLPDDSDASQLVEAHWWKKGLQSRFVKAINPGFRNRD